MKYVLLIFSILMLASCQASDEPKDMSSITQVQSLDTSKIIVEDTVIYILPGMLQSEFLALVEPIDNSKQTYRFLTNEGQVKTRAELYEYEKFEVTSEDGQYKKTYTIFHIIG